MPKDFSGQNLRGRSFKGQNLEGADFSYADLRGTNFTGANLQGANFTGAKAGLPLRWAIFLVIMSWLVSGLSGFLFNAAMISLIFDSSNISNQFAGWAALIITIIIFALIIRQEISTVAFAVTVAVAITVAGNVPLVVPLALAFTFAGAFVGAGSVAVAGAVAFAIAGAFAFAFAFALAVAGAGVLAGAGAGAGAIARAVVIAGVFTVVGAKSEPLAVAGAFTFTVAFTAAVDFTAAEAEAGFQVVAVAGFQVVAVAGFGAVAGTFMSAYVTQGVMKGDKKYTKMRNTAVACAAFGGTTFHNADLTDADFTRATLKNTDFRKAKLTRTRFYLTKKLDFARVENSILSNRDVLNLLVTGNGREKSYTGLNLKDVNLSYTDLREVNLKGADLSGADLNGVNFKGADLNDANLSRANLSGVDLSRANLSEVNLSGLNLSRANLSGLNLNDAKLSGANLNDANLSRANLSGANLSRANLSGANLSRIQALGTNFTKAILTGACLEDWNINSTTKLDDIDCKYVYLKNGEQERRPSNGEFAPGEFTKLFQKALETVDLIFTDGIDWKAFLKSFQELQTQYGDVAVQAIEKKSGDTFVVRLDVPQEANKAEIERQAKQLYEVELNKLEEIYRERLKAKDGEIEIYRHQNTELLEIIKLQASKSIKVEAKTVAGDNISQSGNFGIGVNQGEINTEKLAGNINEAESKTLVEATVEIQQILYRLSQSNPTTPEEVTEAIHQEIKRNPTLKKRLKGALKAGGLEALKAIFNHPVFSIPAETVKGWLEAE